MLVSRISRITASITPMIISHSRDVCPGEAAIGLGDPDGGGHVAGRGAVETVATEESRRFAQDLGAALVGREAAD